MPDITMCKNETCKKKEDCYRFTATPSRFQSYSNFQYGKDGECDDFWKIHNTTECKESKDSDVTKLLEKESEK